MAKKVTRERGIDRAIDILDCLHNHRRPMVVNELAAIMGAPRSTIYHMTKILLDRSILDSYSDGRVFLGRKLFVYGSSALEEYSLIELSKPFIDELAEKLGERVEFNALVDWKMSNLYFSPGKRSYFVHLRQGASAPLPLTASGRFLIYGLDEETVRSRIPEEDYFRHGERVITFEQFMQESYDANTRGYSVTSDLLETHLSAISMPITDENKTILATIGTTFPTAELEPSKDRFIEALKQTVEAVMAKFTN